MLNQTELCGAENLRMHSSTMCPSAALGFLGTRFVVSSVLVNGYAGTTVSMRSNFAPNGSINSDWLTLR